MLGRGPDKKPRHYNYTAKVAESIRHAQEMSQERTAEFRAEAQAIALEVYERTMNASAAARAAGINRRSLWLWRREDPDFRQAWADARAACLDNIEQKVVERAMGDGKDANFAALVVLNAYRRKRYKPETAATGGGDLNVTLNVIVGPRPEVKRLPAQNGEEITLDDD